MADGYEWVDCHNFQVPRDALKCGTDLDGSEIYVGLARFEGDEIPAKVVPRRREAYVAHSGKEHKIHQFKILCPRTMQWVSSDNGRVPHGAVVAGRTSTGEALYVGRTKMNNVTLLGKIHCSHGCLYVPYDGKENAHKRYEVLVMRR